MKHEDWLDSTAWWGTCHSCDTNVVVYRHPEAEEDLPPLGEWENGEVFARCYVCDGEVQWGGSDPVQADPPCLSSSPAVDYPPPLDPDCLAGSHKACHGTAWDVEADDLVSCQCGCHTLAVEDVLGSL